MERKNPFAPEPKTVPSVRNPVLEQIARRVSVLEVTEAPVRAQTRMIVRERRPSDAPTLAPPPPAPLAPEGVTEGDPATPRPSMSEAAVPRVVADFAFIRVLPLGPREGFLLAHVDGASNLRTLVDVTGMTELEVTLIVERLVELGVIEV